MSRAPAPGRHRRRTPHPGRWTCAIASAAAFMCGLDHLVVTTALPALRRDLHLDAPALGWLVNAYALALAVLPLPAAALGDRFGRRRLFTAGLALFTAGSALAALAPTAAVLLAARAVQGAGAAMVQPLSLTLLTRAVRPDRRGLAVGLWAAASGLAIAVGPLVGGVLVAHGSWRAVFWVNLPVGCLLAALAGRRLTESRGPGAAPDPLGAALIGLGLCGLLLAVFGGLPVGRPRPAAAAAGAVLLGWAAVRKRRGAAPLLDRGLLRDPCFAALNAAGVLLHAGLFGSVFLLVQFSQTVQHRPPLEAGLRKLPWTVMPLLVSPLAGRWADRHSRAPVITGLALAALGLGWLAATLSPTVAYRAQLPGLVATGTGMALFFAPSAHLLMRCAGPAAGIAAGLNSALREAGGVLGVALAATVFTTAGSYRTGEQFTAGLLPVLWGGAALVALAAAALSLTPLTAVADRPGQRARHRRGSAYVPREPSVPVP